MPNEQGHEYCVSHVDGRPIDPNATFMILRLDTDPAARAAALHWADLVKDANPKGSANIKELCARFMRPAFSPGPIEEEKP